MSTQRITYGNWLQRRSPGLGPLSLAGTLIAFGTFFVMLLTIMFSQNLIAAAVQAAVAGVFILVFTVKFDGRTLNTRLTDRRRFAKRQQRGETQYVTGASRTLPVGDSHPMPGFLSKTQIIPGRDGRNNPFGAIYYPGRDLFAVSIRCRPDGIGMIDRELVDALVAQYGAWLASLSVDDGLVGATVTVDSAESSGTRVRELNLAARPDGAPSVASQVMDQVLEHLPAASAEVTAYVTLVWRGSRATHQRSTPADVLVELSKRLPGHLGALIAAGGGAAVPMTEADLAQVARTAYDPTTAEAFELLRAQGTPADLSWGEAGPAFLEESRDMVAHDTGTSISYEMKTAPLGHIVDTHLHRLTKQYGAFSRKRVTLLYRPIDIGDGMTAAARMTKSAGLRVNKQGRPSSVDSREANLANHTEEELANGATMVPFSMVATVTFPADDNAAQVARNQLKSLMTASKMQARACSGTQVAAFHISLPFGLLPWEFTTVPLWAKELL